MAESLGKFNVAFEAYYMLAQVDSCINVLMKARRFAEAAIFARAYAPSRLSEMMPQWGAILKEQNLPFQPDDITKMQEAQINDEIAFERQIRQQLYE